MPHNRKIAVAYFVGTLVYMAVASLLLNLLSVQFSSLPGWLRTAVALLSFVPPLWLAAKGLAAWHNEPN